jgi:predicted nucleic acid-binding protein
LADVIVNTSPLQYLHQVGQLDLLSKLFGRIIVPETVVAELAAGRRLGVSLPEPSALEWIDCCSPASPVGGLLSWDLGAGESSVLSLALERPGSWVVLDDKLARQAAVHLNLPLLGTMGILLRAKHTGHLSAVRPVLNQLIALGFRLTPETVRNILDLAGE